MVTIIPLSLSHSHPHTHSLSLSHTHTHSLSLSLSFEHSFSFHSPGLSVIMTIITGPQPDKNDDWPPITNFSSPTLNRLFDDGGCDLSRKTSFPNGNSKFRPFKAFLALHDEPLASYQVLEKGTFRAFVMTLRQLLYRWVLFVSVEVDFELCTKSSEHFLNTALQSS